MTMFVLVEKGRSISTALQKATIASAPNQVERVNVGWHTVFLRKEAVASLCTQEL